MSGKEQGMIKWLPQRRWRAFVLCFFVANFFLSAYFLDVWITSNPLSRALPVLTFAQGRTLCIDDYASRTEDKILVGQHYYSDKAPLPSFVLIPCYEALRAVGLGSLGARCWQPFPIHVLHSLGIEDGRRGMIPDAVPVLWLGSLLCGALPFALIVTLTFLAVGRGARFSPVPLVMLPLYGSFLFVFAGTYFNHVFAALLLLLCYLALKERRYFLAGVWAGLSFLSEFTLGLIMPLWGALILLRERSVKGVLRYLAGCAPSVLLVLVYNYFITGRPFTMVNAYHATYTELGQNYGFRLPTPEALYGLLFSGFMGIFPFLPVLFPVAWCFFKSCRASKEVKWLASDYLAVFTVVFYLTMASFFTWWGGWSYGPRYLVVLGVLLCYEGVRLLARVPFNRWLFFGCTAYGLVGAWLAKATVVYMVPDTALRAGISDVPLFSLLLPEFLAGRVNANSLPSLMFGLDPRISVSLWPLFFVVVVVGFSVWFNRLRAGSEVQEV